MSATDERGQGALSARLAECAYEAVVLHPGIGKEELCRVLAEDYGAEVADVYGLDTVKVAEVWGMQHTDPRGRTLTIGQWAELLHDEEALQEYLRRLVLVGGL